MKIKGDKLLTAAVSPPSSGGVPPRLPHPQQLLPPDVSLHALPSPADP